MEHLRVCGEHLRLSVDHYGFAWNMLGSPWNIMGVCATFQGRGLFGVFVQHSVLRKISASQKIFQGLHGTPPPKFHDP